MSFSMAKKYIKICIGFSLTGALVWIYSAYDFSKYMNIDEMREILFHFAFKLTLCYKLVMEVSHGETDSNRY